MLAASGTGSQHAPFITSPHPAVTGLPAPPQALANIDGWPSKEEVQDVLDIVFLNIGISQQLFDIRAFSDSLHLLYDGSTSQQPRLRIVEALLIFASGRLLQARPSDGPDLPGFALYKVAIQQLPSLPELRQEGALAIGVLGLAAFYLQVTDRKEDAYTYVCIPVFDWEFLSALH
jgi:proline utilization trans-activator